MQIKAFQNWIICFGIFSISVFSFSCTDESIKAGDVDLNYDYFPIPNTKTLIYASDSIIYDGSPNRVDTFRGYIRERFGDRIELADGSLAYKTVRSFKRNINDPWVNTNTWLTSLRDRTAVRTEENLTFIKLVFPFKKGTKWDGNTYLDTKQEVKAGGQNFRMYEGWKYEVKDDEATYTLNGTSYPSVIINNVQDSSIFELRKVQETYAKGIGLVEKNMTIYLNDGSQPNEHWEKKAAKGFRHTLRLIDIQ